MKKTSHYKGHRWTEKELKLLMSMWQDGDSMLIICKKLKSTHVAILKQIQRMRAMGIPLSRRRNGHQKGRINRQWTQGETEYLLRRRNEKATSEEIAAELDRTPNAVDGMIQKLRKEKVNVAMRGNGVKRLWNPESLKALSLTNSLQ